jgi:hypothetical protein
MKLIREARGWERPRVVKATVTTSQATLGERLKIREKSQFVTSI